MTAKEQGNLKTLLQSALPHIVSFCTNIKTECKNSVVAKTNFTSIVLLISICLSACGGREIREAPIVTNPIESVTDSSDSCLAISGGGIRSGAISLGALQELQKLGKLSNYRYLSTVSGGGYPVYGILYQMIDEGGDLASLLEEQSNFIKFADEHSNFIGNVDYGITAVWGPVYLAPLTWITGSQYGAMAPSYRQAIHDSFSGDLFSLWRSSKLSDAANVHHKGMPIPIFGTSASLGKGIPKSGYEYKATEFFELSPEISGSPEYGWYRTLSSQVDLDSAIAISAAAIDAPNGEFQLPDLVKALNIGLGESFLLGDKNMDRFSIYLADGGFIDNLGLLPLLRRGCTDIVVFDNSDDPEASFNSWDVFQGRIKELGWRVTKDLHSINEGKAPRKGDGWLLSDHVFDAEVAKASQTVSIRLIKLGINRAQLDAYPEIVRDFAKTSWSDNGPACNDKTGLEKWCSFPLQATNIQTFSENENKAYRYLGKCLARKAIGDGRCDEVQ